MGRTLTPYIAAVLALLVLAGLAGCGSRSRGGAPVDTANLTDRDCLVRAMYFESNRSSHEGLMAVGTVVMNRVESGLFPSTVCGVVGQRRQFASGVLSRPLDSRQAAPALRAADKVLAGERYAPVGKAMHFHMASYNNPYPARYVAVAGGNAFYYKPGRRWRREYTSSIPAAATSETGPVRGLYQQVKAAAAGGRAAEPCETATGLAATSLACESDMEGR